MLTVIEHCCKILHMSKFAVRVIMAVAALASQCVYTNGNSKPLKVDVLIIINVTVVTKQGIRRRMRC
jgi:hypothetical protein